MKHLVLSASLRAPSPPPKTSTSPSAQKGNSSSSTNVWGFSTERPLYSHDYTECCKGAGVRTRCLGFCSIDNIMEGKAGQHPSACEPDFKKIVGCMADGRNHIPCCEKAQVGGLSVTAYVNSNIRIKSMLLSTLMTILYCRGSLALTGFGRLLK